MAGILHYLDFNHSTTSRKLPHSHKRHTDGLEAPRNSVEFAQEGIPYSCHMVCSKPNFHSNGASMRKLIEQEISSKTNENSKRPSVVARLMGVDPIPGPINSSINSDEEFRDKKATQKRDLSQQIKNAQMREKHPQEEELQKFKTQFEAWQTSKLLERTRNLELENFGKHKFVQSLSIQQKDKGKEKEVSSEDRISVNLPIQNSYFEEEKPLSPTRIVILKPCPEMIFNLEESNIPSPEIIKRENNMENFLEEVKNKLKLEIEGKYGANKTDPKQIARNIANQIRETVVQDINNNNSMLTRSESSRWYQNGMQEKQETRKLLSERIKNVLKREIENVTAPLSSHKTRPTYDIKRKGINVKNLIEEPKSINETDEVSSPRNLVRSLSAPVSGTGFVKLLSEELDLSSGSRLQRKCEVSCEHERKGRKDSSDRNGKVGNLRQNLGLRKWLFGKRIQSADEQTMEGFMPVKNFVTTPSVVVNSGFIQENFTEVPPSPASVCNSPILDGICRGGYGYPSPVSPLDASLLEEHLPINPSARFLDLVDLSSSCDSKTEEKSTEDEALTTEHHAKSYVKTVLVTAGLYKSQPFSRVMSRWDLLNKPIPKLVFEQVEEIFRAKTNSDEPLCDCETSMSHNMLFDLTNEALPNVLTARSTFKKWVSGPMTVPHGKRLLDEIWCRIEKSKGRRKGGAYSLDDLIYDDLLENSWHSVFNEETGDLGVEIELELVEELIDELFWDVLMNIGEITQ